ncbi:hypothetical protein EHS25_007614 [Saitozyma podzolica]|uniref:Alpha-1,3-mannosyltransferase CMT1 n=1 Tax=Saitozyma podzolica TaxID=1890683 RepID=A0A427YQC2_9TREE|nr:hypothetical protein EHS25_007614 [Saitozyma podzolica]
MEGPSDDATPQVLEEVLKPMLLSIGVPASHIILKLRQRHIDFGKVNRISALAMLRNEALAPLWHGWEDTAAVVYFNDVFLNPTDILELLHQHVRAGEAAGKETGITSGLDWWKKKPEYYYDVWVGRTIEGDLFYPMDSSWTPSDDLFPTSPKSKEEYANLNPFQVFSTWAGLAVLAATPFLEPNRLRFRRSDGSRDECAASECSLIANDLWKAGWGRVQVVPSVQVSYERNVAEDILEELSKQKKELGWEDGVPPDWRDPHVNWIAEPPEKVRCHPWPDAPGLSANVWENTRWVDPWI